MEVEVKPTLKILGVTPGITLDGKISYMDRSPWQAGEHISAQLQRIFQNLSS